MKMKTATIKESTKELEESMVSAEKGDYRYFIDCSQFAVCRSTRRSYCRRQYCGKDRRSDSRTSRRCASALGFGQEIRFNRFRVGCEDYRCRIPVYKGKGARLQRALISFFFGCRSRGRLSRNTTSLCRECRFRLRYRAITRQRGSNVSLQRRRFVSYSHSRSSGDEPLP